MPIGWLRAMLSAIMDEKRHDQSVPSPISTLAARIRARRKELGLTQRALSDLAGCSPRFLRQLERGKATVRLDKLQSVLGALGLELDAAPRRIG
jgi:HTH-type transcriptional regulator / antitoxin HipB